MKKIIDYRFWLLLVFLILLPYFLRILGNLIGYKYGVLLIFTNQDVINMYIDISPVIVAIQGAYVLHRQTQYVYEGTSIQSEKQHKENVELKNREIQAMNALELAQIRCAIAYEEMKAIQEERERPIMRIKFSTIHAAYLKETRTEHDLIVSKGVSLGDKGGLLFASLNVEVENISQIEAALVEMDGKSDVFDVPFEPMRKIGFDNTKPWNASVGLYTNGTDIYSEHNELLESFRYGKTSDYILQMHYRIKSTKYDHSTSYQFFTVDIIFTKGNRDSAKRHIGLNFKESRVFLSSQQVIHSWRENYGKAL